jgi:hypothetical protein
MCTASLGAEDRQRPHAASGPTRGSTVTVRVSCKTVWGERPGEISRGGGLHFEVSTVRTAAKNRSSTVQYSTVYTIATFDIKLAQLLIHACFHLLTRMRYVLCCCVLSARSCGEALASPPRVPTHTAS